MLVLQLPRDRAAAARAAHLPAARSMAASPELDLGLVATKITASASGMRASGRPSMLAASTAAFTMGMICG